MPKLGKLISRLSRYNHLIWGLVIAGVAVLGLITVMGASQGLTYAGLKKQYATGINGVIMHRVGGTDLSFQPWEAIRQNRTLDQMLERLCTDNSLPADCAKAEDVRFSLFTKDRTIDVGGTETKLMREQVLISDADITPAFLDTRLGLAKGWFGSNLKADGGLPYMYMPSTDTYSSSDNIIRKLITVQGMYALAHYLGDTDLLAQAVRADRYVMKGYRSDPAHGYAYMVDATTGRVPLGASAMAILMMRSRDMSAPVSPQEAKLADFILAMQQPDGGFQTFLQATSTREDERFYSGEALSALGELAAVSPDSRYIDAIDKGFEYYRALLKEDFWPQYAPWHMQAYTLAYERTHDEKYAEYVYWLADGLIETMLTHDDHARADEIGRFYNPGYPEWGPSHSASTSIYVEGLTYAYQVAIGKGDTARAKKYREAITSGTRALLQVQWTPESASYLAHPEKVVGSFKLRVTNNIGRIDQLGHSLNALVRVRTIVVK